MPNCSRKCPLVQRDLKRIAEKRKALEQKAGPSDKLQKEKSTELEREIKVYEFRTDDSASRSCSKSRKSLKSAETLSRNVVASRSRKSFKSEESAESDFAESDDESIDPRGQRFREDAGKKEKYSSRKRNREEYESDQSDLSSKKTLSEYSLRKLEEEMMKRKLKSNMEAEEDFLKKGRNYLEKFCTCSSLCLFKQLASDEWIQKSLVSVALMLVGVKLCHKLEGWSVRT